MILNNFSLRVYAVIIASLLVSNVINGQSRQPIAFKGADQIVVIKAINADSLYTITGNAILDNGLLIASSDPKFGVFQAKAKDPKGIVYQLEINVRIKDSVVTMTGNAYNGGGSYNFTYPLAQKGNGTITTHGFGVMADVAKSIGGEVFYEKKK